MSRHCLLSWQMSKQDSQEGLEHSSFIFSSYVSGRLQWQNFDIEQNRRGRRILYIFEYTLLKKAKRNAGPEHGDGKFRHRLSVPTYDVGGFSRSFYVDDVIFRHPYVLVLRTLGFFNSVGMYCIVLWII
jgi:hypothetical protein